MNHSRWVLSCEVIVDDIFGQVKSPYYVVRYNSENEIPEGICGGASISYVPEFASHVHNEDLYNKGYDVDEEEDEIEFSDDEKEAEYMRMKRGKSRMEVPSNGGSSSTFPGHGHCSPIYGTGQRLAGATNVNPPFPPSNACPNFTSSRVWRNQTTLPHAPGMPLPGHGHFSPFYGTGQGLVGATHVNPPFLHASVGPNFTSSGVLHAPAMPLHANVHFPHQLLLPGIQAQGFPPFQLQLNPGQGFSPAATVYTGAPQPQFQTPMQFNPGSSAGRGRWNGRGRTFHHGDRKGWRPPM